MINNMQKIHVKASGEYDVLIGSNLICKIGEFINGVIPLCKIAIVTDDIVNALYSEVVEKSLTSCGYQVVKYVFPNGESSKNLTTYGKILNFFAENGLSRTDAVVALGGGVVGDMAGFASATYLRGIKYVQIPTTLLAQIDSSVGGKTAVDLDAGKNLVGAFCQPKLVICDTAVLKTLPKEIFLDGMGEMAKYALLDDAVCKILVGEDMPLDKLVYSCVNYKRRIVEQDEFEGGKRKLLNLGHTVAHGIEKLSGYKIPHGKAVSMGLYIILNASYKHGYIDAQTFNKMQAVIDKCVGKQQVPYSISDIASVAYADKKRSGNNISVVTVHGVGDCRIENIPVDSLGEFLK